MLDKLKFDVSGMISWRLTHYFQSGGTSIWGANQNQTWKQGSSFASESGSEWNDWELFEENPNDARIIVQKLFLQHKHVTAKKKEMVQRKTVMVVADCQLSDCSEQDRQNVVYLSRGFGWMEPKARSINFRNFTTAR
jgi:hypothetical protein